MSCESLIRDLESKASQLKSEITVLCRFESLFFKLFAYELGHLNKGFEEGEFFIVNRLGTSLLDASEKYKNSFLISFRPKNKKSHDHLVGVDENYNLVERVSSKRVALVNLSQKTSEIYDWPVQSEVFKTKIALLKDLLISLSLYKPND